jgi:2'-hydroxyisoflavone reductase
MGDVINESIAAAASDARPVWVTEAFLAQHSVVPWTEMPLWIPGEEDDVLRSSSARAQRAGLARRELADTVRATLEWTRQQGLERTLKAGLTRQREAELLTEWKQAGLKSGGYV